MEYLDQLGPAERAIARQLDDGFADVRRGLEACLSAVEDLDAVDWSEVMQGRDGEDACEFVGVLSHLPQSLAPIGLALMAARGRFTGDTSNGVIFAGTVDGNVETLTDDDVRKLLDDLAELPETDERDNTDDGEAA